MNAYARRLQDVQEFGCKACALEIEELGPELGPQRPPDPMVHRWAMTPQEWAGQEPMPELPERT